MYKLNLDQIDPNGAIAEQADAISGDTRMDFLRKATYQLSPQPMRSYAYGHEFEAKYRTR